MGVPMLLATDLARLVVQPRLHPGSIAIDATVGNGHDTLMLAEAVGAAGHVHGFDIQADALARTRARVGLGAHVTLHQIGHEHIASHVPAQAHGDIAAIMFNLGYLPGAAKTIVTQRETTLTALAASLSLLRPGGVITIVLYPGHAAGRLEADAVRTFAITLPPAFSALHTSRLNSATPTPELLVIERLS